jgi:anti-sigma factor RsiW
MKCVDYVTWIAGKLDGSLSTEQSRELRAHPSRCARCRAELLLQRRLAESLAESPPGELSPDFTARVIREATATVRERVPVPVWPIAMAALAAAAGVASVIWADHLGSLLQAIPTARLISPALTWISSAVEGAVGIVGELPKVGMPTTVPALGSLEKLLVATVLGSVPLVWCFYQVYAFLRE